MKLLNVQKVDDIKEKLVNKIDNILKIIDVDTLNGVDYHLAKDIYSNCNVPAFNKSRVDGYAVLYDDCKISSESSPSIFNYVGEQNIGEENITILKSNECMYVPTGGMIPANAEAMIMIENTEKLGTDIITINKSAVKNENITFVGDDIKKNSLIFKRGTIVDERVLGNLCSLGITKVKVYDKPKVFIISSGDELVLYDELPNMGQTREVNSIYIKNTLQKFNFNVLGTMLIEDNKGVYKKTIIDIVHKYKPDIILTSGGSSKGDKDYTCQVFEEITNNVFCEGIGIKPGKPTILAEKNNTLFIGLPGHPVSAYLVLIHVIINSFFKSVGFFKKRIIVGKLDQNIVNKNGNEMLYLAKLYLINGEYMVEPIYYNSTNIGVLSWADGYFVIDENTEGLVENSKVEVYLF